MARFDVSMACKQRHWIFVLNILHLQNILLKWDIIDDKLITVYG